MNSMLRHEMVLILKFGFGAQGCGVFVQFESWLPHGGSNF